jgi:type I restriction enzyme S subunit
LVAYLEIFFSSDRFRRHISGQLKSSAGHQRITLDAIRQADVVLPPLEEQQQIVKNVYALFELADRIGQCVANAKLRIDGLTQSILAKAFRGELVPQDPDDEPASVLLGRIQGVRDMG